MATAHFAPGDIVRHRKFGYRGVVADVDAVFMGTDAWYQHMAKSRPPRDTPWYKVLVDGSATTTYVAERHLEADTNSDAVDHPELSLYFDHREDGRYGGPNSH